MQLCYLEITFLSSFLIQTYFQASTLALFTSVFFVYESGKNADKKLNYYNF